MPVLRPTNALPSVGAAFRWFVGSGKGDQPAVRLLCHVKSGASATREGVSAITDECVEVCVAGQARDGEANKAVVKVIAEAVKLPKSNVQIVKGLQSRQKVVNIDIATDASPEEKVEWIRKALTSSLRN